MNPFHWRLTNLYSIGTHLFQVFLCFLLIIPKRSRQPRPVKYFDGLSLLVNLGAITSQSQQFPRRASTISSHNAMSYCNVQYICFLLAVDPSEIQNIYNGSLGFLEQYSLFFFSSQTNCTKY